MNVRFPFISDSRKVKFNFVADNVPRYRYPSLNEIKMIIRAADNIEWNAQILALLNDIKMQIMAQSNQELNIETSIDRVQTLLAIAGKNFGERNNVIGGLDGLKMCLLDLMHLSDFNQNGNELSLQICIIDDGESGKANLVLRAEDDVHVVHGIPIKLGELDQTYLNELDPDILPDFDYL